MDERPFKQPPDGGLARRLFSAPQSPTTRILLHGVVSSRTSKVVEFFLYRVQAETFIERVRSDDSELAGCLRVEAFEVEFVAN
jgi:hypothetical protein